MKRVSERKEKEPLKKKAKEAPKKKRKTAPKKTAKGAMEEPIPASGEQLPSTRITRSKKSVE